jgi:hypothetical protein
METLIGGMARQYYCAGPDSGPGNVVMQFDFEDAWFYLRVDGDTCTAHRGRHNAPAFTVHSPVAVWEAVSDGSLEGAHGLMSGQYRVDGDLSLFVRMNEWFSGRPGEDAEVRAETTAGDAAPRDDARSGTTDSDDGVRAPRGGFGRGPVRLSGGGWITAAFLPWIVIWSARLYDSPPWSSLPALGLALLLCLYHLLTNRIALFEAGTLVFTCIHAALAFADVAHYTINAPLYQHLFLAALWTGSLTRRNSLTAEFMQHYYPRVAQESRAFIDTNRILTAAWSLYYIVSATLHFAAIQTGSRASALVYLLLVPISWFTNWFQKWYPARLVEGAAG